MRKFKAVCNIFGILFTVVVFGIAVQNDAVAQGQDLVESVGQNGKVNWTQGYVEAIGIGAPPESSYGKPNARPLALRAGKLDAYRNLLEVVKGVRIDSTTEVKDFTVSNDTIRAQVEGLVKGAQVYKQDYMSDGTVEVTVRMSLGGDLAQAVLPIPKVLKSETFDRPRGPLSPEPKKVVDAPPSSPQAMVFTGMVIDARGIQARPAMAPKIVDESGQEVYGSMQVDREFAVQQGMSGYARDLSSAQSNSRVTNNPVTLKGVKTDGPGKSNIVISNADAQKIRSSAENLSFLKKARVMIVLD